MTRWMIWLGGFALLAATAIDTLAVAGRNLGWSIHGSIELIQAAVLVAGAIALLLSSIAASHAKVHLLVDRLQGRPRDWAVRANTALTALLFALLLAGSGWTALDLWNAHEIGEITGVPWRWMRLFANLCFAATIVVLLAQAFGRKRA